MAASMGAGQPRLFDVIRVANKIKADARSLVTDCQGLLTFEQAVQTQLNKARRLGSHSAEILEAVRERLSHERASPSQLAHQTRPEPAVGVIDPQLLAMSSSTKRSAAQMDTEDELTGQTQHSEKRVKLTKVRAVEDALQVTQSLKDTTLEESPRQATLEGTVAADAEPGRKDAEPKRGSRKTLPRLTTPRMGLPLAKQAAAQKTSQLPSASVSFALGTRSDLVDEDGLSGLLFEHANQRLGAVYAPEDMKTDMVDTPVLKKGPPVNPRNSLNQDVAPVCEIEDIFAKIAEEAIKLGIDASCSMFETAPLRVVTMCSGTESPLLALELLQQALDDRGIKFKFDHLASAEIEPRKQGYIQLNFNPPLIFRDVTEFVDDGPDFSREHSTAFGGAAEEPSHFHLLVAGPSCVDYSNLNNKPKGFGEKGQSYDTMTGIQCYARRCRPAVIILENVEGAPWNQIQTFWKKINYHSVGWTLDSKDFWIPQTRNRGYLVLFDELRAETIGFDLQKAAKTLELVIKGLSHRATAPYSDFLFKDDDPEFHLIRQQLAKISDGEPTRTIPWEKCRHRYAAFRATQLIGTKKPFTRWSNNGTIVPREGVWLRWLKRHPERIWETLEVMFLAYLCGRSFDMPFKHRIIELSQNVGHESDSRQWGMISCLTPSGMPYDTHRGGPITGKEALKLQGIPQHRLLLNKQNSKQLQDLAGNAMTSTVVGSVIIAALIACVQSVTLKANNTPLQQVSMFEQFPADDETKIRHVVRNLQPYPPKDGVSVLNNSGVVSKVLKPYTCVISRAELQDVVARSVALCQCDEGGVSMSRKYFSCVACGHTVCLDCKGNPNHQYEMVEKSFVRSKLQVKTLVETLTNKLPSYLRLRELPQIQQEYLSKLLSKAQFHFEHRTDMPKPRQLTRDESGKYRKAVLDALACELFLSSTKYGKNVRMLYESATSRLELRITPRALRAPRAELSSVAPEADCRWLLFAKPPKDEPAQGALRELLAYPIAEMSPQGPDLLQGCWKFWNPELRKVDLLVEEKGDLIPSWSAKLGLYAEPFRSSKASTSLHIKLAPDNPLLSAEEMIVVRRICGEYNLLQDCEGACGMLHRKVQLDDCESNPTFFFLNPKPLGEASLDRLVFSDYHDRLPDGVYRAIIAEAPRGWRPGGGGSSATTAVVSVRLVDIWDSVLTTEFDIGSAQPQINLKMPDFSSDALVFSNSCCEYFDVLSIQAPLSLLRGCYKPSDVNTYINLCGQPQALQKLQWLLKNAIQQFPIQHKQRITSDFAFGEECDCIGKSVDMIWGLTQNPRKKTSQIRPHEDRDAANALEQKLRTRPIPVVARLRESQDCLLIEIKLDVATLVHRLRSRTPTAAQNIFATWSLESYVGMEPTPSFPKLKIVPSGSAAMWPQNEPTYQNDVQTRRPHLFRFDRELFQEQLKSLDWMRQTEQKGIPWTVQEIEDIPLQAMNVLLRVDCSETDSVHGGVLADEIGAGKSTSILALIACGLEQTRNRPEVAGATLQPKRVRSQATLLLVPPNLINQWQVEMWKCFDPANCGISLLVVERASDLSKLSVQQICDTEVLLAPWDIFEDPEYWSLTRRICIAPNVPDDGRRAFRQWFGETVTDLEDLASHSMGFTNETAFWTHRDKKLDDKKQRYSKFAAYRDSKQTGSAIDRQKQLEEALQRADGKTDVLRSAFPLAFDRNNQEKLDWDLEQLRKHDVQERIVPLLHMFEFERIVVDEFTYLGSRSIVSIAALRSKLRWLLSGTPPLSDFLSLNTVARLLGTRIVEVREADAGFTFMKAKAGRHTDLSYAEEFRQHAEITPVTWLKLRNANAEKFVRSFFRQNRAQILPEGRALHYEVLKESIIETFISDEAYVRLMGPRLKFNKHGWITSQGARKRDDYQTGLVNHLQCAPSAEAALLCASANMRSFMIDHLSIQTEKEVFHKIVQQQNEAIIAILNQLVDALKDAWTLWESRPQGENSKINPHFFTFIWCVLANQYGDSSVSATISKIILYARDHRTTEEREQTKLSSRSIKTASERLNDFRHRAAALSTLARDLIEQVRRKRLAASRASVSDGDQLQCASCKKGDVTASAAYVLGLCGHITCRECLFTTERIQEHSNDCVVQGCHASVQGCAVPAERYAAQASSSINTNGSKASAITWKCQSILTDPTSATDKIIIFAQDPFTKAQVVADLQQQQIDFSDATKGIRKSEKLIRDFQESVVGTPRILIVQIDSPDAAGWNLQAANHVVFVSPFLAKRRSDYWATVKQAIGRAFRFGQTKKVHVYHFILARTIEVDITETRAGKKLAQLPSGKYGLLEYTDFVETGLPDLAGLPLEEESRAKAFEAARKDTSEYAEQGDSGDENEAEASGESDDDEDNNDDEVDEGDDFDGAFEAGDD